MLFKSILSVAALLFVGAAVHHQSDNHHDLDARKNAQRFLEPAPALLLFSRLDPAPELRESFPDPLAWSLDLIVIWVEDSELEMQARLTQTVNLNQSCGRKQHDTIRKAYDRMFGSPPGVRCEWSLRSQTRGKDSTNCQPKSR
ncbi:hypothetical protein B0H13DRAFT_1877541 [Mycena leptocephala]|nr:hypothetical protein B0H13DRAFT_1877541 [Mycena leptocephala]